MNRNLECCILSCLLLKPELMEKLKLEDKHFKNQKLWHFMKAFYKKFKTFDLNLMFDVCTNDWKLVEYVEMLFDYEPVPNNFEKYQQQLLDLYDEQERERWLIERTYNLANELYVRSITFNEFKKKVKELENASNTLFKKEGE